MQCSVIVHFPGFFQDLLIKLDGSLCGASVGLFILWVIDLEVLSHLLNFFSVMIFQVRGSGGGFGNALSGLNAQPAHNGIKDVFRSVYMEGGVHALYRGVGM